MAELRKLKRAVVKEEYIAITGDFQKAIILNQFIYWSERVSDFDDFIKQENKRALQHGLTEQDLTCGWLYKTAEELSDETMLCLSPASMRSHIKALIDLGFISERNNPKYKWDRTKQYRVNLLKIAEKLNEKGYAFENYKIELPFLEIKNGYNDNSKAIPKITTETTTENTTDKEKKERKKASGGSFDSLIAAYVTGEDGNSVRFHNADEIVNLLQEWLKVRKAKRAAMTDRAIELNLQKLDRLARESKMSVADYLKEVICRGWQAFYPIQTYNQPAANKQERGGNVFLDLIDDEEAF